MKIFNVSLTVRIIEQAEVRELPEHRAGPDPVAEMVDKLGQLSAFAMLSDRPRATVSLEDSFTIAADGFSELQRILEKFHSLGQSLTDPAVPR